MEAKVAREMKVAPGNVDITAKGGSVVLTINIGYDNADTAASASTTMAAAMSDNYAAATMLTTDAWPVTTADVSAVPVITSGSGASAPAPPPPAVPARPPPSTPKKTDDTMSVGAIAGIAVGASVAVILVAGVALFMMNKKKAVTATKG